MLILNWFLIESLRIAKMRCASGSRRSERSSLARHRLGVPRYFRADQLGALTAAVSHCARQGGDLHSGHPSGLQVELASRTPRCFSAEQLKRRWPARKTRNLLMRPISSAHARGESSEGASDVLDFEARRPQMEQVRDLLTRPSLQSRPASLGTSRNADAAVVSA